MRTFGIDERSEALTPTVRVLATDYPKGHLIRPHHHEWAQLIYARAGVMTVLTAAGAWVVPPQRAVWMPAGMEHAIRCATRLEMRTLYIDPAVVRDGLPAACGVVSVTPLLRELVLAARRGAGRRASAASCWRCCCSRKSRRRRWRRCTCPSPRTRA